MKKNASKPAPAAISRRIPTTVIACLSIPRAVVSSSLSGPQRNDVRLLQHGEHEPNGSQRRADDEHRVVPGHECEYAISAPAIAEVRAERRRALPSDCACPSCRAPHTR